MFNRKVNRLTPQNDNAVVTLQPYQYLHESERAKASIGDQVLRHVVTAINENRFSKTGDKKIITLDVELG